MPRDKRFKYKGLYIFTLEIKALLSNKVHKNVNAPFLTHLSRVDYVWRLCMPYFYSHSIETMNWIEWDGSGKGKVCFFTKCELFDGFLMNIAL